MKREWRCTRCGKLLGVLEGNRLHIRFARGHEYIVGLPVTSVCRSCRTLNELRDGRTGTRPDEDGAVTVTS
jgi:phage FluMu protein Com